MDFIGNIKYASSTLLDLFYPRNCASCGTHLFAGETEICKICLKRLPRTRFEYHPTDNAVSALLWGRCKVDCSYALFYYRKGERVQQLLHSIKYKGNKQLGVSLGREIGKSISDSNRIFDVIIPVPLHPLKEQKRGFNQSEVIAQGIQEILKLPINTSTIKRAVHTSTQTRKGRFERWKNVEHIFKLSDSQSLIGKHILVVDDVITTGSTMEACINTLANIENTSISLATVACASL